MSEATWQPGPPPVPKPWSKYADTWLDLEAGAKMGREEWLVVACRSTEDARRLRDAARKRYGRRVEFAQRGDEVWLRLRLGPVAVKEACA